jgi:hypothetical protein
MIDRREILEAASSFSLLPSIVEKDYVLGWMLAGINAHEELSESCIFKGGTGPKKCYFETYRFSEDLDFTLRNEDQLDEEFLRGPFEEVIARVRAYYDARAVANTPAGLMELVRSYRSTNFGLPSNRGGSDPALSVSGPAERLHTLRPARSPSRLATLCTRGSNSLVA